MADAGLRKLKRADLLELLIEQTKQTETQTKRADELQRKLENRQIKLNQAGSIAEAALQLNGVFEAAQSAAAQYLESLAALEKEQDTKAGRIRKEAEAYCEELKAKTQTVCDEMRREAEAYCHRRRQDTEAACVLLKQETEQECSGLRQTAKEECRRMKEQMDAECRLRKQETEQEAEARRKELSERLEHFYELHRGLKELLEEPSETVRETEGGTTA